jgi:hypothetical protein
MTRGEIGATFRHPPPQRLAGSESERDRSMRIVKPLELSTGRLVRLAKQFRVRKTEAEGRCLSASLELAEAALQRHGMRVELVKWHVADDPSYVDHWAVLLDADNVIDLTRVQVDGTLRLVSSIDAYPESFQRRRVYPASLLLDAYVEPGASDRARLSDRFMWQCGTRLFRFDMAEALRRRDIALAALAIREVATFINCFSFGWMRRVLEARSQMLLARLQQRPDVSARSTHYSDLTDRRSSDDADDRKSRGQ